MNDWGNIGVGSLKLYVRGVRDGAVYGIGPAVWLRKEVEAEGVEERGGMSKKCVSHEMQQKH